ncbi:hypothetical protein AAKU55_001130 [Oxalobacteraceae bacterium GrIS 1.11]
MLQANEIQQSFRTIEQAIGEAAQACSAERNLPNELRDCIQRLDRQSDLAREVFQSHDEMRIRKLLENLEQLGERARKVCGNCAQLTSQMKNAVFLVHEALAGLKHRLN